MPKPTTGLKGCAGGAPLASCEFCGGSFALSPVNLYLCPDCVEKYRDPDDGLPDDVVDLMAAH